MLKLLCDHVETQKLPFFFALYLRAYLYFLLDSLPSTYLGLVCSNGDIFFGVVSKKMSTESAEAAAAAAGTMMCCASCGIAEVDDIKLKMCNGGCDLMKYCSDDCQKNHREHHEEECRKRVAELRDRDLFTQPDSSYRECPICYLPLPLDNEKSTFVGCCSKVICLGCDYANKEREKEAGFYPRCAFCRDPLPKSDEEFDKNLMARIKKNDPDAMRYLGNERAHQEGDYKTALEYLSKAAGLGDTEAHYNLSFMYDKGHGVAKDTKKEIFHLEEAAIGGHPMARHNLGCIDEMNDRFERARRHFTIAASLGYHDSLKSLKRLYADGHATKEDYAGALRAYQTAFDATKSADREKAERERAVENGAMIASYVMR